MKEITKRSVFLTIFKEQTDDSTNAKQMIPCCSNKILPTNCPYILRRTNSNKKSTMALLIKYRVYDFHNLVDYSKGMPNILKLKMETAPG